MTHFEIQIIADAMYPKSFKKDEYIIKFGDIGSEYYILNKGNVEVTVYKEGTKYDEPNLN